jgi:hypothetical protein
MLISRRRIRRNLKNLNSLLCSAYIQLDGQMDEDGAAKATRYEDGLGTGGPGFESWQRKEFFLYSFQSGFGAHAAFCPMSIDDFSPLLKTAGE